MTTLGGAYGRGTIFKIKPDGTDYYNLADFDTINGMHPSESLVSDGTYLYGMTPGSGAGIDTDSVSKNGNIFKIKLDGSDFTNVLIFNDTNGYKPTGSLIFDGKFLYGVTKQGGVPHHEGVLFKIKPDGSNYTKLVDFSNVNGKGPETSLIFNGTFLYGMTSSGESDCYFGTIFKYQYCTTNCCYSHYKTAYDTIQNIFIITVDSSTNAFATSYYWDFGDGNTSTQFNPTHVYTKDTTYNVCLKITTASGDTCSYCHIIGKDAQGNIYRVAGFTLHVVNLNTKIETNLQVENISISPNPTSGSINFILSTEEGIVAILNIIGESIYQSKIITKQMDIDLSAQPNGVYLLSVQTNQGVTTKKIVISK
jgi:hypothetical protein